jgi:hypothetical protein
VQAASASAGRAGAGPIGDTRNGGSFRNASGSESEGAMRNSAPIKWMTALERRWYRDQGLQIPQSAWTLCAEGERTFDYRLLFGR